MRACTLDIYAMVEALFERRRQGGLKRIKKIKLFFKKDF